MNQPIIKTGLKLRSVFFSSVIEIVEIREARNQVDVIVTPSDGNAYVQKNWDLSELKHGFQKGDYFLPDVDNSRISVY